MEKHKLDWNAKLVRFFVDNPRLVWMLIAALVIGGVVSLGSLRREGFPAVTPKVVLVQTLYPQAPAGEVETQVTRQIESALKDVKDLRDISSTSANSFSNVVVTLDESVDIDTSVQEIQSLVTAARSDLPADVEAPKVQTFDTSGPAFLLGVTRDAAIADIRSDALKVADELSDVSGVKSADLTNELENRIIISFDLTKLAANGVSLQSLATILGTSNANIPTGKITTGDKDQAVLTVGAFGSVDDIQNVLIGANPFTGAAVKIKDVAAVTRGTEASDVVEQFGYLKDDKVATVPGVMISVSLTDDADIITTRQAILDQIREKQNDGSLNASLAVLPLYDQGESTQDQINEIVGAAVGSSKNFYILGGLQLLFLGMLLFVNWRSAIVAALAVPFSLGATFISLALMGIQLNTIVLFSLILVLGLVVDPAIVMVEAIQRYRDLHFPRRDAVIESGRRYGASLFMAVLTSLIVFFPFGVVSGIFGEIIKYIPLTVIPALIASYFVPIALLPALSKQILKPSMQKGTKEREDEDKELSRPAKWIMKVNTWILAKTRRKAAVLIVSFVLVVLSASLVGMGKIQIVQFAQPEDNEFASIHGTFDSNLSLAKRQEILEKIEKGVAAKSGVEKFYYFDQNAGGFYLYIDLKKSSERKAPEEKSKAIVASLKEDLGGTKGLSDIVIAEVSSGTPEAEYQIQTQLYDNDLANLKKAAKDVGDFLGKQEHVIKVDDGFTGKEASEIEIALNRDKVQAQGLSSVLVGTQLKALLDETEVSQFVDPSSNEALKIYLKNSAKPASIDEVKNLVIGSAAGVVKVSDIADVREASSVEAIQRFNGSRFVNVQARVEDSQYTFEVQKKLDDYLTDQKLDELGLDSRQNRGEFEDIAKSFRQLGIALGIAIFLTYVVLVLQFRSFSLPGIMLFTIPLSLIGVFPALWLTKSDLGFLELLGVTILVGIVENVAIFLVDYANQVQQEKGLTPKEAIIQASGVRFRPIILTKVVALAGLLPLAIESEFWRGLSVVIIAGIGLSGFFSLVVIPILYVWIEKLRTKVHKRGEKSAQ